MTSQPLQPTSDTQALAGPSGSLAELLQARHRRLRLVMRRLAVPALLIVDPIDILYATGARNMTVFASRSTARYLLLFAEGPSILFEYYGCEHLAAGLPTIDEIRGATGVSHTTDGPAIGEKAQAWAEEIAGLMRHHVGDKAMLAVGRLHFLAVDALRTRGMRLIDADTVMAEARRIKLPEEVAIIRQATHRVEAAAAELSQSIQEGAREMEVWAEFHRGLIAREGEYISTRLLQSGPRTLPYFQECGARPIERGDLVCFDSDALGYQGYAVDFSRSFLCGDGEPSGTQRQLYRLAYEQLNHNIALFQPGTSYRQIAEAAWPIPEQHRASSYYCIAHGLGLSGEYPNIPHARPGEIYPLEGYVEPGMVLCVESYIGSHAAGQGVKLEDQLLITESGAERLTRFPFDERLLTREI